MAKLVECIPNFSCSKEKDEATYNALVEAANSVPGCTLFDAQTDGNHNRCVFTLIGDIKAIEEVAFQLTKVATERIDMTRHKGEHKRMERYGRDPLCSPSPRTSLLRSAWSCQARGPAHLGRAEGSLLPVRGLRHPS